MCNQFFDPGFLFDFYSDRGSTATPFGRSNIYYIYLLRKSYTRLAAWLSGKGVGL